MSPFSVLDSKSRVHSLSSEKNYYVMDAKFLTNAEPMRYAHIRKTVKTVEDASENDPLEIYLRDTPDVNRPLWNTLSRISFTTGFVQLVSNRSLTYTINGGDAFISATPAPVTQRRPETIERLIRFFFGILEKPMQKAYSREQRRRSKEFRDKMEDALKRVLGNKVNEMFSIDSLATAPAFQRRGYGGMLLDMVTNMADKQDRESYLFTSNLDNIPFYNEHGFFTLAEIEIGNDNPTWDGPPVVVPLMIRNPKKLTEKIAYIV